jgi:hypothetical protein
MGSIEEGTTLLLSANQGDCYKNSFIHFPLPGILPV